MKKSNVSEKSRGVVIFASNTETVDYVSIAGKCAKLVNHYLGLPVTLLENNTQKANTRYNIDSHKFEPWYNQGRASAYELSPYDQTILIDCDLFILDKNFIKLLDTVKDYLIVKNNRFVDGTAPKTMGPYSIPHLWATAVVFNKTAKSKLLFDLVQRIENNYKYYRQLYNIKEGNFRNDYAFTIADTVINGYSQDSMNYIPWSMPTVSGTIQDLQLKDNKIILRNNHQAKILPKQSLHILSKEFLSTDIFDRFIEAALDA